jgi:hypothetical protein
METDTRVTRKPRLPGISIRGSRRCYSVRVVRGARAPHRARMLSLVHEAPHGDACRTRPHAAGWETHLLAGLGAGAFKLASMLLAGRHTCLRAWVLARLSLRACCPTHRSRAASRFSFKLTSACARCSTDCM